MVKLENPTISSFRLLFSFMMASTVSPRAPYTLFLNTQNSNKQQQRQQLRRTRTSSNGVFVLRVFVASQGPGGNKRPRGQPGVDTRIHWDNPDEGWIGGNSSSPQQTQQNFNAEQEQKNVLGEKFADLLKNYSDSHYQFLGLPVDADLEEIKAAYRRLSKEYHPDTTSLPLKAASEKFLKLREVYDVLSNEESRRFYDWTLAQEAASREAEKLKMRFEDPYEQELNSYVSVPDLVDRLGGRNLELSDQAMTALTIDVVIIVFAFCCIIYVLFFKEPYY